jgi:3-(methylthio)propionyl---CoA ligase
MAKLLERLGVRRGDRVGTMAWNGYRHLEAYFAVAGMGAVIHTINPRLFPEQNEYIFNHADDRFLFIDITFVELVESLIDRLPTVEGVVVLTDAAHMPQSTRIPNLLSYETLLDNDHGDYEWPVLDEHSAAALCYTSGTTGNPKGALYSHRSTILHAYGAALPDALNISARDVVLPVVPMFHVNAWGLPYSCALTGAKLVFPGQHLDGKTLHGLFEARAAAEPSPTEAGGGTNVASFSVHPEGPIQFWLRRTSPGVA